MTTHCSFLNIWYPDNSPPGQFAPDNSPPIFKQLAPCSFIHYRAKQDLKCMKPRLNAIEIILRYPLPSLEFGGELSGVNCPGGELSGIRIYRMLLPFFVLVSWEALGLMVSAFVSRSSVLGLSPGWGHCVVFLEKTLNSDSGSLHKSV